MSETTTQARCVAKECGAPTRDGAFLCDQDMRDLARKVGDMQSLLHEVSVLATGQTRVYRANGRTPQAPATWDHEEAAPAAFLRSPHQRTTLPETKLMVNLPARELLWEAYDTLLAAACDLGADEISSRVVTVWLSTNLTGIRTHPEARRLWDELTYLHRNLERSVDRSPSRVYAGPCRAETAGVRCDRKLFAWPGSDDIRCDGYDPQHAPDGDKGCGAVHTTLDRQEFLIAELNDALLPILTWQTVLPKLLPDLYWPHRTTWVRWTMNQRLIPHGLNTAAAELFRGGDVIDLVVSEQARIVGNQNKRRMSA